ncbi:hypothetical protein [Haliscomenobacter sp.]|uniref:hypothetical protein n=1 Tax=Haliscomenobacter sp. TaxID=2717303 RepID=UPI003593865E
MNNKLILCILFLEFFASIILLSISSCSNVKQKGLLSSCIVEIIGPVATDTTLTEDKFKDISHRFIMKISNTNESQDLNIWPYNAATNKMNPLSINYSKKSDKPDFRMVLPEIFKTDTLKIKTKKTVEKRFNIHFFPEFDTVHFDFKCSFGDGDERGFKISYLIVKGRLKEKINQYYY